MRTEIQHVVGAASPLPAETATQRLLRLVKERQGIPSNYKLRQVLDVSEVTMTRWNQGRGAPANSLAMRMAEMAGLDPGVVIAEISADRAQDDDERALWQGIAARLKSAGLAAIFGLAIAFAGPAPEARAFELVHASDLDGSVRYVNSQVARKPRHLAALHSIAFASIAPGQITRGLYTCRQRLAPHRRFAASATHFFLTSGTCALPEAFGAAKLAAAWAISSSSFLIASACFSCSRSSDWRSRRSLRVARTLE